jgi:uncharacterized protein YbjQ (UPF0145 family)
MFGRNKNRNQSPQSEPVHVHTIEDLEAELTQRTVNPFTTHLDAHQLYLLRQGGFEPIGIPVGVIVYSMGMQGVVRSFVRAFKRGEMSDFSHFNQIAREVAIARMQKDAATMAADGVVGVKVDTKEYVDFIEVVAMGTAVKRVSDPVTREVVVGA